MKQHKNILRMKIHNSIGNQKAITLIALVVTIVILLILAGITINMVLADGGIFNKAEQSKEEHEKGAAREKLELKLADMQIEKYTNSKYNKDQYLTDQLQGAGFEVNENIVTVDGWQFEIDRSVPKIVGSSESADNGDDDSNDYGEYMKVGLQCYLDSTVNATRQTNTWEDLSGKNNHATINGATWTDQGLTFDGVDDWANLGYHDYGNVTLELIFDVNELTTTQQNIFGNWEYGGYGFLINSSKVLDSYVYINNNYTILQTDEINAQTKYKMSFTSNGNESKLYINGELAKESTSTGVIEMPDFKTFMAIRCKSRK